MQERRKRVAILTLGCRVNQSESSVIEGTLREHGISIVSLEENPDYCIVNTCTVTGKSDASSRYLIRRAVRTRAEVIVTGCYSELEERELFEHLGVHEVFPTGDKEKIIKRVLGYNADPIYFLHDRARPYLKVQDGCNFSCTYCAVPLARGRSRSVPLDEAVARASDMALQGYHEIVLTGIHLGGYGQDLFPKASLAQLIRTILLKTSLHRIRLSSLQINEINDELIELLGDQRVCRHLHLPLQSGSDLILGLMNRNYTARTYQKKLLRLAAISSDIALGTDVIAGFPAEGDEEFMRTHTLIKELPFSYVHTFPYSARIGTAAAYLKPQVPSNITSDRVEMLKELSRAKQEAFASAQADKTLDAIAEEDEVSGYTTGTTSNYLKVDIQGSRIMRGSVIFIRTTAVNGDRLRGVMIS